MAPSPSAYSGADQLDHLAAELRRVRGTGSRHGKNTSRESVLGVHRSGAIPQPGSGLARWFVERVGTGRGRIRKITAVALARKLLVALWRYLATGLVPEGACLKAT